MFLMFSSLKTLAQYNQGKLTLNDGKELNGLLKITKGDDIKYKENEDSKVKEYDKKEVSKFEFNLNGEVHKYIYAKTIYADEKESKYFKLLQVLVDGKVSLYLYYSDTYNGIIVTSYYVKRESEPFPLFYQSYSFFHEQKFIPFACEYFKDCEALVQKIKTKELKHTEFKEVVLYYNEKCN